MNRPIPLPACPFCKGMPTLRKLQKSMFEQYEPTVWPIVYCSGCGARTRECKTEDEAAEAWALRNSDEVPDERL
jgi:C4-type Zn-finger protein